VKDLKIGSSGNSTNSTNVQSFREFLIQQDHATKPEFAKTLLAPGRDTKQNDVGLALKSFGESSSLTDETEKDILTSWANSFWDEHVSSFALDPLDPVGPSLRSWRDTGETSQDMMILASTRVGSPQGRSYAAQLAYCRSLMSSRNESRLTSPCTGRASRASDHEGVQEARDSETRVRHLHRSFTASSEEVAARLEDLRRRPVWDAYAELAHEVDESCSSRPQSSMTNQSLVEVVPGTAKRQHTRARAESDASADMPQESHVELPLTSDAMRYLCQSADLSTMPMKRLQTLSKMDDQTMDNFGDAYGENSQHEEFLRAVKKLNTYRWFCRLPPVLVDEEAVELCAFTNESLASRKTVFVKESQTLTRQISDLGEQLGGFLAKRGSAMILHKEGSLISAIDVGVLCSHTGGWSYASSPAPGTTSSNTMASIRVQEEVLRRANVQGQRCSVHHFIERPRPGFAATALRFPSAVKEVEPVSLQNLPEPLSGYRTMWEMVERLRGIGRQEVKHGQTRKSPGRVSPASPSPSRLGSATSPTRPGTGASLPSGRTTPFQERPTGSTPRRIRAVSWGSNETARRREWNRAGNLSWGDRTNTVTLRRQLLSPKLRWLGGSRLRETCVLWSASNDDGKPEEDRAQHDEPDFVVFPPLGVCPMELLSGCNLPTWTIMPSSHRFQPTHALQVRMWRVKLLREEDSGSMQSSQPNSNVTSLSSEAPYDALRLEELPLSFVTCDCSSRGNSFCIIFRPQLTRISEGDQFEVEVLGLLGSGERQYFFHDFRSSANLEWKDHCFLEEVEKFCGLLGADTANYVEPQTKATLAKGISKSLARSLSGRFGAQSPQPTESKRSGGGAATWHDLPALGLVTHTSKEIKTDDAEIDMFLHCAGASGFAARLHLQRADGNMIVERATRVFRMGDYYMVCVKLPCAVSKYELSFHMATAERPDELVEHPYRYTIKTTESSPCPISSLEHPGYHKFGLCPMPAIAQIFGLTICAPLDYGLLPGSVYFLLHLHPDFLQPETAREPTGETPTSLLFRWLRMDDAAAEEEALRNEAIQQPDPLFTDGSLDRSARFTKLLQRRDFQNTQRMLLHRPSALVMDPTVNVLRRLHRSLEWHLGAKTQDVPGQMRFDLVVSEETSHQRFAVCLQQNLGFPEFFDGVLHLNENDAGSRVELFFCLTRGEESPKQPLKIGEWQVVRPQDALPS